MLGCFYWQRRSHVGKLKKVAIANGYEDFETEKAKSFCESDEDGNLSGSTMEPVGTTSTRSLSSIGFSFSLASSLKTAWNRSRGLEVTTVLESLDEAAQEQHRTDTTSQEQQQADSTDSEEGASTPPAALPQVLASAEQERESEASNPPRIASNEEMTQAESSLDLASPKADGEAIKRELSASCCDEEESTGTTTSGEEPASSCQGASAPEVVEEPSPEESEGYDKIDKEEVEPVGDQSSGGHDDESDAESITLVPFAPPVPPAVLGQQLDQEQLSEGLAPPSPSGEPPALCDGAAAPAAAGSKDGELSPAGSARDGADGSDSESIASVRSDPSPDPSAGNGARGSSPFRTPRVLADSCNPESDLHMLTPEIATNQPEAASSEPLPARSSSSKAQPCLHAQAHNDGAGQSDQPADSAEISPSEDASAAELQDLPPAHRRLLPPLLMMMEAAATPSQTAAQPSSHAAAPKANPAAKSRADRHGVHRRDRSVVRQVGREMTKNYCELLK